MGQKTNFSCLLLVLIILFSMSAASSNAQAEVSLPKIFSDNMVLQRDMPVKIWGWAEEGESVTVSFNDQTIKSTSDKNGNWRVVLKPAQAGGPYSMTVQASNKIELKNILIGEVWICSGQSNMQWEVKRANDANAEIASADYPESGPGDIHAEHETRLPPAEFFPS